jgi:hypothetical protein
METTIHLPGLNIVFLPPHYPLDWPVVTSVPLPSDVPKHRTRAPLRTAPASSGPLLARLDSGVDRHALAKARRRLGLPGGPGPLPLTLLGGMILRFGVTRIPSLHNLTAPKMAHSWSQPFEASTKLLPCAAA